VTYLQGQAGLWFARYVQGESFRGIAKDEGCSYEYVRVVLYATFGKEVVAKARELFREKMARIEEEQARIEEEALAATAEPCPVCGHPNIRGTRSESFVTCSPACARVWAGSSLRYQIDEERYERHRRQMAESILRHPATHKPSAIAWAKRYLADPEGTPANRRYFKRGSVPHRLLVEGVSVDEVDSRLERSTK
jgi:endogenous inhibitor of DNA gyrase (YacG/DUF329 family)